MPSLFMLLFLLCFEMVALEGFFPLIAKRAGVKPKLLTPAQCAIYENILR